MLRCLIHESFSLNGSFTNWIDMAQAHRLVWTDMAMTSEDLKQYRSHMDHFYHTFIVILILFKA